MKKNSRILAMLMALAMVFAFMPAMAFAGDEEPTASLDYSGGSSVKECEYGGIPWFVTDDTITITSGGSTYVYQYGYDDSTDETSWIYQGEGDDPLDLGYNDVYVSTTPQDVSTLKPGATYEYNVVVKLDSREDPIESEAYTAKVMPLTYDKVGHLYYDVQSDGTVWVDESDSDISNMTSISIPSNVTFEDGVNHKVTGITEWPFYNLPNCKSVTVPATVTYIADAALGFYYDKSKGLSGQKLPGFTIFGKTGSAAQKYAQKFGFAFRDLEAEAALASAQNINKATVTAADIKKASNLGATSVTLGSKVKKISKNAFKGTNINTVVVKTKKLKASKVKKCLKGSKVSTIKVSVGKKKVNKKYVKKYKKIFTKKNAGKKVKVKAA